MRTRTWVTGGVALAVLAAGGAAAVVLTRPAPCGSTVTSVAGSRSHSPFLDAAGRRRQPDERRDRVVSALGRYGSVVGAVGYDYGQWAQLSAYDVGLGVRTKDDPDFTMLDDALRPRWSVQVDTAHSTYDADTSTYLVAAQPTHSAPTLVALDVRTGHRRWCAELGGPAVRGADPFATQLETDGGVVVLGPGGSGREQVLRLDGHGKVRWSRTLDADSGDYLGDLGAGLLLAGGRALPDLYDAGTLDDRKAGTALVALDAATGRTAWSTTAPAGEDLHVLGVSGDRVLVVRLGKGSASAEVEALDRSGRRVWSTVPARGRYVDATLRSGRVLVRAGSTWTAYDAGSGRRLWRRTYPDRPQLLPYGFELDSLPLLDADTALLGTTTALRTLDLSTGELGTVAALPSDGISTTYWPYQVVVTDGLVGVATNTSAVVLRRR